MLYSANQISAKLLLDFSQKAWIDNNPSVALGDHQRYLMMHDLYIKARSYSMINKVAFWFALCWVLRLWCGPLLRWSRRISVGKRNF